MMIWISLHIVLVLATVLRILSRENLSPITRLAWFLVMILIPILGIIIYFLFGEINLGEDKNARHKDIREHMLALPKPVIGDVSALDSIVEKEYQPAFRYAASINGFGPTTGNSADLMPDEASARQRLVDDIDNSKSSVYVLYYIWMNDETGINLAQALIRAAKRGVVCKAMVDGLGSRALIKSTLWKDMERAGVDVSIALPFNNLLKTMFLSRFDLRNHRKITVIDDTITYCGSQNCADPEYQTKPKYAPWIDILLRFKGPVVTQNQLLFASDWIMHRDEKLETFVKPGPKQGKGFVAQVWGDGPTERTSATPQMFATLFGQAQKEITISTPYFVPSETVLEAMCAASYRGVDVSIIFPAKNDSWIVGAASRSYYREMLDAGIRIFEFNGGLLHAKTLTLDGVITLVGSSNMDLRSFDLNYENNILLYDRNITQAVIDRQSDYIAQSEAVTIDDINQWRLHKRIWNNIIATFGPVL